MVTALRAGSPPLPTERSFRLPESARAPVQGGREARPEAALVARTPMKAPSPAPAEQAEGPSPQRPQRPGSLVDIRV